MKIRLRSLSDVWKLDAIYYDDSKSMELIIHQIEPLCFQSDSQNDLNFIKERDDRYIKLLPHQIMNLEYAALKTPSNKKITYAVTVGGYLYEWIIDNNKIIGDGLKNLNTSTPKMVLIKNLLKNIDTILPIIYNDWKNYKLHLVSRYQE